MIKLPEVCFYITRQHAHVGHKNINIFSYKNHRGKILHNWKTIYIKDLPHNFVQLLVQELVMT
jgi:hypothetical protein